MKTIKIIDLLNKIANGEELPKKIKYNGITYIENNRVYEDFNNNLLLPRIIYICQLNDEVEIIEDGNKIEKIERLEYSTHFNKEEFMLYKNILAVNGNLNDLIDKVNELEKRYEKQDI